MLYCHKWLSLSSAKGLCTAMAFSVLATVPAHAEKIAMETASPNSALGIIPQAMASHWSKAGVDIQLSLNQTLTKSLLKLGLGKLDSAVVPPLAYNALKKGVGPYKKLGDKASAAAKNVRSLFGMPGSLLHAITWADSGINSWADVADKRVFIGPPAGAANKMITTFTAAGGISADQYQAIKAPWGVAAQGFQDGQYDLYVGLYGLGSKSLAELSLSKDIRLLSVAGDNQQPPKSLGLQMVEIPANTYPGQVNQEPVVTWQTLMMLAVRKDLAEETAYQLTKAYFEQRDTIAKSNAILSQLPGFDPFAGVNVPLHAGAARYFNEVGIDIPNELTPL